MQKEAEIPCTTCRSWNRKQKKFTCNPDDCKELTEWLFENLPKLCNESTHLQVRIPEIATQYIV